MPSPFPGMDPYLEDPSRWPGLHDSLIVYIRDELQPRLGPDYFVEIRERVYLENFQDVLYPDAIVRLLPPEPPPPPQPLHGGLAVLAPVEADQPAVYRIERRLRESFLEVLSIASKDVVAVIEVISPANKAGGEGRVQYRRKQAEVMASNAHLVEIDLLRHGPPVTLAADMVRIEGGPYHYLVSVNRATRRHLAEVYAFTVRDRLPRVAVPLRHPDPDVPLNLPALFARCYDNAAYARRIDYRKPPVPPLDPADEAWADALLRAAGRRGEIPEPTEETTP